MHLNIDTEKRILILGSDGYIGIALYELLRDNNYDVFGLDNNMRERNVINIGSGSLTHNKKYSSYNIDVSTEYSELKELINALKPSTIINLAQQPSAPFSMIDPEHATETQRNNICGGLNILWVVKEVDPNIHIIQIGTAGEYPDWLYDGIEVPEGSRIEVKYKGKDWTIPTPRYAGSWYHFSKLHSSYNADYANRIWGLKITDINQGIVYGHYDGSRFDYDQYFGTVVNRFITQAVAGIPLTVYGSGGQMRSFINIQNSIQAIKLLLDNPPKKPEYRIINQLTETYKISQIAEMVKELTDCDIQYIDNPRSEMKENEFTFTANKLRALGLKVIKMKDSLPNMIKVVKENKDKINKDVILPETSWK